MILAVDTSLGSAVAVLGEDGAARGEASSADPLAHAEVIGVLLEQALAAASASPHDIALVVAGTGPGLFTGLRVGLAAAHTFAVARGIPVVGVPSHDAVALVRVAGAPLAVVTDMRRREVAYSVYTGLDDDGLPVRVAGPTLAPRDGVDEHLLGAERVDAREVSAVSLGRIAIRARAAGRDLADARPLYLRAPDVTLARAQKRLSA